MKTKVIHKAPGKKGKREAREFKSVADALAYIERNTQPREHGKAPRIGSKPANGNP